MCLKYIKLENYIEIVSNIYFKLIQYSISQKSYNDNFIYINLNSKDIKDILKNELKKYRKTVEAFGNKVIYVNTSNSSDLCYLNNNENILIDNHQLKKLLDKYWISIFENKYELCFRVAGLSSKNLEIIITNIIGEKFLINNERKFSNLIDDNENEVITNEQINKIGQQLMLKGVINYVGI